MKQQTKAPSPSIPVNQYVPYGINGEYFIYDNEDHCIPLGYGSVKGTKKFIQGKCDELNRQSIPVKEGQVLDITKGEWIAGEVDKDGGNIVTKEGWLVAKIIGYAPKLENGEANAKAICTAVNNTYGKGYNPAAMEELYKGCEKALRYLDFVYPNETDILQELKTALTNAKL